MQTDTYKKYWNRKDIGSIGDRSSSSRTNYPSILGRYLPERIYGSDQLVYPIQLSLDTPLSLHWFPCNWTYFHVYVSDIQMQLNLSLCLWLSYHDLSVINTSMVIDGRQYAPQIFATFGRNARLWRRSYLEASSRRIFWTRMHGANLSLEYKS